MSERINEGFVDKRTGALQERYGAVDVVESTMEVPAAKFDECVANARDGYVGGAYAWVSREPEQAGYPSESYVGDGIEREQALLVLPRGDDEWGIPGGGVEDDESFERAARRETLEETGVGCEISGLWLLDRKTWQSTDPDEDRETVSLHAFFDADYVGGSITVQPGEVDGAAWFAEPPAALMEETAMRADSFF
ncbi:NUDIX hydrolase [Halorubellus litoreus]|uniref:NUDIX hydrolase n=1 Tax=Halorubellus litoreus TaxID=755308 RepID=A0ABD5VJU1_9EURY